MQNILPKQHFTEFYCNTFYQYYLSLILKFQIINSQNFIIYLYKRNPAQLQQLLAYSQYPINSQQFGQIQQLLSQQQQTQQQQLSAINSQNKLQIQQASVSELTSQQQQQQLLLYQQYLSDPQFSSLSQQQQQYIIYQIQLQQQQLLQSYQTSAAQTSQNSQQQLLQYAEALKIIQQQQQQQQNQYQNQQQLLMKQFEQVEAVISSTNKQELNYNQCICKSCDRLLRDLNKLREEEKLNKAIECVTCNNKQHPSCVKVSVNSEMSKMYECPSCTLQRMDPLNKIVEIIQSPIIISGQGCITYFQVQNELYLKLGKKKSFS